jgi:hypothetical protein
MEKMDNLFIFQHFRFYLNNDSYRIELLYTNSKRLFW